MRILQSITYYLPYVSGITIYAQRLGEALFKRGYQVKVLTSQYESDLQLEEKGKGVRISRVPVNFSVTKGPVMLSWLLAVWQSLASTDLVLIHSPQFEGFLTAILAKVRKIPVIVVYHCEVTLPANFFNIIIQKLLDWSGWVSCFLADRIVVYTEDYAKSSRVVSVFLEKITQIYPPVILASEAKPISVTKKRGEIWIGFSGRISTEKGIEYLLEALNLIQKQPLYKKGSIKLIIAGSKEPVGERQYVEKINRLVQKNTTNVVFLGNLSQQELVTFYRGIDLLVLPSINSTEAFGLVQVEAMLAGVPVVATDLPGVRIPIKTTKMGKIVPLRRSDILAKEIMKILENKSHYIKPRKEIEEIFNFNQTIKAYERVFKELS